MYFINYNSVYINFKNSSKKNMQETILSSDTQSLVHICILKFLGVLL